VTSSALIFGASGGLAIALANDLLARGWTVDLVSRESRRSMVEERFSGPIAHGAARLITVAHRYAEFQAHRPYNAYIFTQALFEPRPLSEIADGRVEEEIQVGLTDPISLTRSLLRNHPPAREERRDFAFIGSTSSYAGFRNTAVYCAVKHALVGFVRAMNDEYTDTETRFWLFSMGTMNTEMGAMLVDQDSSSFLQPADVAHRICDSLGSPANVFEPEIVMRRRKVRFKTK
jgi:NAD(P)-dependent dehydrogenase (short-subunit alcohol dehydrogenase family)